MHLQIPFDIMWNIYCKSQHTLVLWHIPSTPVVTSSGPTCCANTNIISKCGCYYSDDSITSFQPHQLLMFAGKRFLDLITQMWPSSWTILPYFVRIRGNMKRWKGKSLYLLFHSLWYTNLFRILRIECFVYLLKKIHPQYFNNFTSVTSIFHFHIGLVLAVLI